MKALFFAIALLTSVSTFASEAEMLQKYEALKSVECKAGSFATTSLPTVHLSATDSTKIGELDFSSVEAWPVKTAYVIVDKFAVSEIGIDIAIRIPYKGMIISANGINEVEVKFSDSNSMKKVDLPTGSYEAPTTFFVSCKIPNY